MKKQNNLSAFLLGLLIFAIVLVAVFLVGYIVDAVKDYSGKAETASENRDYYNEGYDAGYYAGFDDGELAGYSEGYDKGFDCVRAAEWAAVEYATENCKWCPEEAMAIIDAYEKAKSSYVNDSEWVPEGSDFESYRNYLEEKYGDDIPSEEDYKEAVRSLCYFYSYFYSEMYDELKE